MLCRVAGLFRRHVSEDLDVQQYPCDNLTCRFVYPTLDYFVVCCSTLSVFWTVYLSIGRMAELPELERNLRAADTF